MKLKQHPLNQTEAEYIEDLYEEFYPLLKNTALSICPESAEDVVIETCIRLSRKVELLKSLDKPALAVYLRTAVRNAAITEGAKHHRFWARKPAMEELYQRAELLPGAELENQEGFNELLAGLSALDRDLVFFRYCLDFDLPMIAKETGLRKSYIADRLYRARKQIKKTIKERKGNAQSFDTKAD